MTDRQKRNILSGTSALGGASATSLALDSDALQLALLRRIPRYKVQYLAGIGAGASGGSGEARMAANNAIMARRNGINGVFVNPYGIYHASDYGQSALKINHNLFSASDKAALRAVASGETPAVAEIAGAPVSAWQTMFSRVAGGPKAKAKVLTGLVSGKYDTFLLGELSDNFKVLGSDAINGRLPMMSGEMAKKDPSRFIFSGERGMRYSQIPGLDGDWTQVNEGDRLVRARNVGRDAGFAANYTPEIQKYIPASSMDTGIVNRSNILSSIKHKLDRRALDRFITTEDAGKIGVPKSVAGKKIIFLSGGSAGPLAPDKIKEVLKATEGMDNVHILAQTGGGVGGPHQWYGDISRELEDAVRSGKVTVTNYVPKQLISKLYNGADLNLAYGGSSSATEMLGIRTPSIFMQDSNLNAGNIAFARKKGLGALREYDSAAAGVYNRVEDFMRSHPGATAEDAYNHLKHMHIAQGTLENEKSIFDRAMQMGAEGRDAARRQFRSDIEELLDPKFRNSPQNTGRVKNAIRELIGRNKEVIGATRNAMLSDAERLRGVVKNLGKIPLRYKIPAIAVGAAAPAIATHYALKPKPPKDIGDKVMEVFRNFGKKK